ncbi:mitochondrial S-adenosylmethionine carrier protein isoform 5-T5 [Guaruba guarouba]
MGMCFLEMFRVKQNCFCFSLILSHNFIEVLIILCCAVLAGGVAGVCVDLILFPLDTVKTRLQSPQGFRKAGGFRGIYAGVPSTAIGSFPNAAVFFITYENVKSMLHHGSASYLAPATHMVAASLAEVVACLIRVPSEVVKQRAQVSPSSSTLQILSRTLYHEGIQGLYRGYKSTVLRENYLGQRVRKCLQTHKSIPFPDEKVRLYQERGQAPRDGSSL